MDSRSGWHCRGYLPHYDQPGILQAITFRLADSLPAAVRDWSLVQAELDRLHGLCALRDGRIASMLENLLLSGDGASYSLLAWVIMPNHVHVLIETLTDAPVGELVRGWKGPVAREANRLLGRSGRFWEPEYHDRYIRDADHLQRAVLYLHNNPVVAGLVVDPVEWPFSSAHRLGDVERLWHDINVWL